MDTSASHDARCTKAAECVIGLALFNLFLLSMLIYAFALVRARALVGVRCLKQPFDGNIIFQT